MESKCCIANMLHRKLAQVYLGFNCRDHNHLFVLELDFEPFNASVPRPSRSSSIGNGVQFLNRHLSSNMFRSNESLDPLLDFLRGHNHKGNVSTLTGFS